MAEQEVLSAPSVVEYPFTRTTGPVIGAFFTALREGFIVGIKGADGQVIVPPVEYDPVTSAELTELVEVGDAGEVTTWAWVTEPTPDQPLADPFAWALIKLDGADTPMLGAVAAESIDAIATGSRVTPVWAEEREGHINDLAHWVLEAEGGEQYQLTGALADCKDGLAVEVEGKVDKGAMGIGMTGPQLAVQKITAQK
jgi:uncharacterized OB-fold protein